MTTVHLICCGKAAATEGDNEARMQPCHRGTERAYYHCSTPGFEHIITLRLTSLFTQMIYLQQYMS